jgi:glycerate kinase
MEKRNPEVTTSYGTGELIRHAMERGAKQIQLAIGGSATNDGGLGLLMALGWQFLDGENQSVGWGGQALAKVRQIIPPAQNFTAQVTVLADVTNPFYGSQGAAFVYAPQKGANSTMVQRLDQGLQNFAGVVQKFDGFNLNFPGAGAAGGVGGGVVWGLHGQLESGFTAIAKLTKLEEAMKNCDLVITGEGSFDHQSLQGKVVGGVINLAQKLQKPVIVVAGQSTIKGNIDLEKIFTLVGENTNLEQALANPQGALTKTFQLVKAYLLNSINPKN